MPYYTTPDGCRIFYTAYGIDTSKQVVIFLNGTTQTTLYWGNHVPSFSKRYGLLFYDARGQGQSDLGTRPISLEQHVSDPGPLGFGRSVNRTARRSAACASLPGRPPPAGRNRPQYSGGSTGNFSAVGA
ncbi:MAG: hypothetical protein GY850_37730 [bacterium]|nr:hypothetical protein [bacterium]